ncbi:molecular chaperone HtpG [Aliikangiella coralliicola]|uniref:Chaperone protein HtpG n=1 Tax=Aliikangiella coralliicola TaxID=2592383 RepID=A0A545U8J7_9GAMM|nr:molecular chaperone HtpG [Aliikangiella coralliicola]TQV85797.1 molecular chaperone HtpG [Aliikangiella coralliicola]
MSETVNKETHSFQTEVKQLLNLMIHSLYSNKEIFLRELISNAADAADKLRFEALSHDNYFENDSELKIRITADKEEGTLTIADNGIGMSREEVMKNLGTIARSGTAEFLEALSKEQKSDSNLIGQFGVGFYSAFIVADKVEVRTRRAGEQTEEAVSWISAGEGEFTIEPLDKESRGTEIILHLKEEEKEFLEPWRLRSIIGKYSDHISLPVEMEKVDTGNMGQEEEEKEEDEVVVPEFEVVNKATALWTRGKSDIEEDEYKEFYKHISHDFNEPLVWSHNKVEGKQEYTSLLYLPKKAPFDLWNREKPRGVKLYVQRVFIMDDAEQFLPVYLRMVRGVLDSNDLPLNVSREILQDSSATQTLRNACVKRVLSMLEKLAKSQKEDYQGFWDEFGSVLKEGLAEDHSNREKIAGLMRFASTHENTDVQNVSLNEYVERMKPEQDKIYYLVADNFATAKNSPHLEIYRKKGIEVLLLSDRIDEWAMGYLTEFGDKKLQAVTHGELDLGGLESEEDKQAVEKATEENSDLIEKMKTFLGEKVEDVKISARLDESPACVVSSDGGMSLQMARMLKAAGQPAPEAKPVFEINIDHQLVKQLDADMPQEVFEDWVALLFDQAVLADSGQLEDPSAFTQRLNRLLMK